MSSRFSNKERVARAYNRFAAQHPEYGEAKWIRIIRKAWQKMPEVLVPLILKAAQ